MIIKVEVECPYCTRLHIHRLDIGIADISEEYPDLLNDFHELQKENILLKEQLEEKKSGD